MYRVIVIGMITGLLMGMIAGPTQGADKDKVEAQEQEQEIDTVTVLGRLVLKPGKKEDWLILRAKDAKTYHIHGEFVEILKGLLSDLGEDNLVSVSGTQDGLYNISCHTDYDFDSEGNRVVNTQCIRYYHLYVTQIIDAKESDEKMPPPERDTAEERRTKSAALSHLQRQELALMQIGTIKGKIVSLNLRSPIKTVEIAFRDKDNQPIDKVLLLSSNTLITKKILQGEEPIYLSVNSLQVGQEVYVEYSQDKRKTEALLITITKE